MIGFVGLSHLGLVYGFATAAKGFDVVGFDCDLGLCGRLERGEFPVSEPGLDELFLAHRERLRFVADPSHLGACSVVFYALDVPTDAAGNSDLEPLRDLVRLTAPHLAPDAVAVVLCQVPPGFTRALAGLSGTRAFGVGVEIYYQVETLVFGRAVERAMHPERYIVGCADPGRPVPVPYAAWLDAFECPVLPMLFESAELAKIAINFFLVSSVSTTNTLAEVCEKIGADWMEIAPALRLDGRIGPKAYLSPGLGISGGNLERDLVTVQRLTEGSGVDSGIVGAWQHNSVHRKRWLARALHDAFALGNVSREGAVVALLGLAYKENTHSIKNSPALEFLHALHGCAVRAYDPVVRLQDADARFFRQINSALESCAEADALVIATPWPEFRNLALEEVAAAMRGRVVLDPFRMLDGKRAFELGFDYYTLGAAPLYGSRRPSHGSSAAP